jgi:ATP-dependent Clp protease ATP-binding subunit ClpA
VIGDDPAMTQLTVTAKALLQEAHEIAKVRGHDFVGTEHILLAMARRSPDSFARRALDEAGATDALRSHVESVIGEA